MKTKVYLLSLGCAKNQVNAEQMLALLEQAGMEIVAEPAGADAVIVNTCGFIEGAKTEAIEAILEMAELKSQGLVKALVVTGCLTERYKAEFLAELPEVDAALGTGSYGDIVEAVQQALEGNSGLEYFAPQDSGCLTGKRHLLTPDYTAYLRIAEGCNNRCSYCVIPFIRGRFRSVPMEDLIAEAKELVAGGAKELLVIAQDITRYGMDLYGKPSLAALLQELEKIEGLQWIRLHYLYPDVLTDELLETCAKSEKILHYFDMPIQHINDRVLKRMNRHGDGNMIRERIRKIREYMPDAVIRTSLIVGFPGETEEEFTELYDFLCEYRLERAGVFCYSQEEGSAAAEMPDQIDEDTKELRRARIYQLQEEIMEEKSRSFLGKTLTVLCCGEDEAGNLYGRSYMDSPDIDGLVFIKDAEAEAGEFLSVQITYTDGCDLYGTLQQEEN
jgi:ribosomal protein S12 methylthiotransferase